MAGRDNECGVVMRPSGYGRGRPNPTYETIHSPLLLPSHAKLRFLLSLPILACMATLTRLYPLLKQLGLDDQHSQEFIETLETGLLDQIATKVDIEKVRAEIEKVRAEIEKVRAELKVDIEKVRAEIEKVRAELLVKIEATKSDLLRWLFGFWVTLFLAILALFLKLPT